MSKTRPDTEKCRTCGEDYALYGDGYDGECPNCADLSDPDNVIGDISDVLNNFGMGPEEQLLKIQAILGRFKGAR